MVHDVTRLVLVTVISTRDVLVQTQGHSTIAWRFVGISEGKVAARAHSSIDPIAMTKKIDKVVRARRSRATNLFEVDRSAARDIDNVVLDAMACD